MFNFALVLRRSIKNYSIEILVIQGLTACKHIAILSDFSKCIFAYI